MTAQLVGRNAILPHKRQPKTPYRIPRISAKGALQDGRGILPHLHSYSNGIRLSGASSVYRSLLWHTHCDCAFHRFPSWLTASESMHDLTRPPPTNLFKSHNVT